MFKLLLASLIILALATTGSAQTYNGLRCALSIDQYRDADQSQVLLYTDTVDILEGIHVTGFTTGLSIDIELTEVDSLAARMNVHAHVFATQPDHAARTFQVEYDLPARIEGLTGKNGAQYRLTLMPLEPLQMDTEWCRYSHHAVEDFGVDPSAHMNIYYVPQTLGDFHWNAVKGLLEEEYENFNRMTNFSMPGKYLLYLCPCRINTVIWDDRFGMMVDPVRSTMFAIYSKEYNSVYPFLISQAATYRNYGYAPAFLSEGFANYLSFAIYEMKQLKAEHELPSVVSLLNTATYYGTEPVVADRISATFVRYLVDKYGIGVFLRWYRAADDLNQLASMEEIYETSAAELETEWLTYVDTVQVKFTQAGFHTVQAETMLHYDRALDYARETLRLAANPFDSLQALAQLSRSAFFMGDYYAATDYQIELLNRADTVAGEWMKLAGYRMMNGEYDQAATALDRAAALDSANPLIEFNRALNHLHRGDTLRAQQQFRSLIEKGDPGGRLESQVILADILDGSDDPILQAEAATLYHDVVAQLSRQDRRHNPSATQAMWLGIAYLGIEDTGNADDFLRTALYLETRSFYLGMINLWLGKVADTRGERSVARDFYSEVLAGSSAHYHQEEARRLLKIPYRR